jgi:hypothetical protein
MASERPEGSGSMGDDWVPSTEMLEERELLSGLVDGISDLAAGPPVEEAAAGPDPVAEEPPAVVAPLAAAMVGTAESAATPAPTAASSQAPALTNPMPIAAAHSTPPGAEAVDSLLARAAVESGSHADAARAPAAEPGAAVNGPTATHAADSKAAAAHAAAEGEARLGADVAAARAADPASSPAPRAHAVNAPNAESSSAHGAEMAESWVDGREGSYRELEFTPTDEEAAQPHMTAEVSSGEHTVETVEHEMPELEDNQSEVAEAPIERSLVQSASDQTAPAPSWVGAEQETTRVLQAGEAGIVEQAGAGVGADDELVSRVSQLFDLVPNWPGVDLDALEDAARTQVEDGSQFGSDIVDVVSTRDVSSCVTAAAGAAVGIGIARRELGLQTRDAGDGPTDEEAELGGSFM